MGVTWSQFFPPEPALTEKNLASQAGKVFIVTGGYSGVGLELAKILYRAGGTVYLAGRSQSKAEDAIREVKRDAQAIGNVKFLEIDLADLTTIKPGVNAFLAQEQRLDILFNNAGVSLPPAGTTSAQGHELMLATNCLGPYLLTRLLLPLMLETAARTATTSVADGSSQVRIAWTSSIVVDAQIPSGGLSMDDLTSTSTNQQTNYANTKLGNWLLAAALAAEVGSENTGRILSVTYNPGNLKTNLTRHMPWWTPLLVAPLLYHAKYGAYTALWAGLSPDLRLEHGGSYIVPWGRLHPSPRADLLGEMRAIAEGGSGLASQFQDFCETKTKDYR